MQWTTKKGALLGERIAVEASMMSVPADYTSSAGLRQRALTQGACLRSSTW